MRVVKSIDMVKIDMEYQGNTCMLLGYAQNHTDGTYCMINLHTKWIILSRDAIWLNKTYGEYVSRKENTKSYYYILQTEDDSYIWAHVKIDSVKN